MPAAVLVPAIIGAAGAVGGAAISAHAAGKAASQQQQASSQALALQERMYQQQRADLQPWVRQGGAAIGTLGALMGLGGGGGGAPMQTYPLQNAGTRTRPPDRPIVGQAVPRAGVPLADIAAASPAYAVPRTSSGYITMRAPDGTVADIPPDWVDHYTSIGAVRL